MEEVNDCVQQIQQDFDPDNMKEEADKINHPISED